MKLLMISTDRSIFQEGSAVRARMIERAKEYEELHIIVFAGKSDTKEAVIAPNCWAYSTESFSQYMYPFDAIKLGRFIIEKRGVTDITCQDPFLTAMAGVSLKKQFKNIQLEIQVHTDIGSPNFTYSLGNKIRKMLALNYIPKADSIRVVSNRIKDYLIKTLKSSMDIIVKPISVNVEWIKSAPITFDLHKKYPQFTKIVFMASRLEREKDIALAIKAWPEVIKKIPMAGLLIVGSGSEEIKLKSLAGSCNNIIFESWANKETLASYYKTADLLLSTSLYEGYGLTFIEAKAVGCKIVSTDVGIAREAGAFIVGYNKKNVAEVIVQTLNS